MLALAFLLLIGTTLIADACGAHIPKGYIYAAMGFSVFVESLNMVHRRRAKPVHLRQSYADAPPAANGNGHGR
jgi:predicted tellurium resistance membrane protein TerC